LNTKPAPPDINRFNDGSAHLGQMISFSDDMDWNSSNSNPQDLHR